MNIYVYVFPGEDVPTGGDKPSALDQFDNQKSTYMFMNVHVLNISIIFVYIS